MTATMTHDQATDQATPKITTTTELIARADLCVAHPQWEAIIGWVREEIVNATDKAEATRHLERALGIAETVLVRESNKLLFATRRDELIARAERCFDSPYWRELTAGFYTRLIESAANEKFGPKNVADVIRALDALEPKLLRMQERALAGNEPRLRKMGLSGANAAVQSHHGKGNRHNRRK